MSLALHEDKHDVARQRHGVTTAGAVIAYYRFYLCQEKIIILSEEVVI